MLLVRYRGSGMGFFFQAAESFQLLVVLALLVPVDTDLPDGLFGRGRMLVAPFVGFSEGIAEMIRAGKTIALELMEFAVAPGRSNFVSRLLSALRLAAQHVFGVHGRDLHRFV